MAMPEIVVPGSLIGELAMLVEHDYASTIVARDRVFCLKLIARGNARADAGGRRARRAFPGPHDRAAVQTAEELRQIDDAFSPLQSRDVAAAHRRNSWPPPAGTR